MRHVVLGAMIGLVGCSGGTDDLEEGTDDVLAVDEAAFVPDDAATVFMTVPGASGARQELVTFGRFRNEMVTKDARGMVVVNGDEPVLGVQRLFEFFLSLEERTTTRLSVHQTESGVDAMWSDEQKRNLTYCVRPGVEATLLERTKLAIAEAAREWEAAANVKFVHVNNEDGSCGRSNAQVTFNVDFVSGGQYLARAFFPDSPREERELLVDESAFREDPWPLVGIMRHELGHVLGFRHEHTRAESGTCFEDNRVRPLTEYDRDSVMHYPQCNGNSASIFALTDRDKEGAQLLYGAPVQEPPPPPPPSRVEETFSRTVGAKKYATTSATSRDTFWKFNPKKGTTFVARTTGTGNVDLYLGVGPTFSQTKLPKINRFDARSVLDGSDEEIRFRVRKSEPVYLRVRGASRSEFKLVVKYTPSP